MLQWMGGSRRKVTTSRKSTQKRQKQYFEQRKRQQQNVQMMGSDKCYDKPGISGQSLKEHSSLDILNLLNLSKDAQNCNPFCPTGRADGEISVSTMPGSVSTNQQTMFTNIDTSVDSCRLDANIHFEAGAPLCCQIETSPKKVSVSSYDQNTAFNRPPSHWKSVIGPYSELSVIDLLCDDEPNTTVEKYPTCEDHVSFSLEGLGKVGTETPVHSPELRARIPYRYSPLVKDGKKPKLKNLNNVLNDIELEVDTMMQDIKVSPISSLNFPYNKVNRSSAIARDCNHFYDHTDKNCSSIDEEFFYKSENSNEDTWNASSSFLNENFDEMGYDTSCKTTFQMSSKPPELLKRGACKTESYAFDDLLQKKWSSATATKEINMNDPLVSFSKDQLEDDFDFYVASRARLDGNFNAQNLIPEDVRDNSSLLSEESSSSIGATARGKTARGKSIAHSPPCIMTEENRRKHRNAFASPRNKCSTKEEKWRSMSNPSKRISTHYPTPFLQEELGSHNSCQFEERYASVDRNSVVTSFCDDLEANFAVFGSKNRTEDPFSIFTTPELHNKASPSLGGYKNAAPLADSPPCSFTSEKFAFDCSTAFPNDRSWPSSSSLSPDFQFKGKRQCAGGFHCDTSSTDMSVQESVSKGGGREVESQKDRHKIFEREDIFMGDNELSSEKKMTGNATISNNIAQESEGTEDTNAKATQCLETADSPGQVEEISSSLKEPGKHESRVDNRKSNCDAETPLTCKITSEEIEIWQPEGRNTVRGKYNNGQISFSGQVMFESYVFQRLHVQKVMKEACT